MAMTKVSEVTVGSGGAAEVIIDNIPQTGKDLLLLVSGQINSTGGPFTVGFFVNGSSGTSRRLLGNGSTVSSSAPSDMAISFPGTDTANTFGNASFYIANYTSTTAKSVSIDMVTENNATAAQQRIQASQTTSTAAVTAVRIADSSISQHTTLSLYIIS